MSKTALCPLYVCFLLTCSFSDFEFPATFTSCIRLCGIVGAQLQSSVHGSKTYENNHGGQPQSHFISSLHTFVA